MVTPRRAGVSSFGIGGTNAHVVLEEAPPVSPRAPTDDARSTCFVGQNCNGARSDDEQSRRLPWSESRDQSLSDVEWTLQVGRQTFRHRRAVVGQQRRASN